MFHLQVASITSLESGLNGNVNAICLHKKSGIVVIPGLKGKWEKILIINDVIGAINSGSNRKLEISLVTLTK
ncbi:hypothetical protein L2E82_36416 [Cichorium intybus]|uniref:Uncharacterized protein n=1 Tax=Cichorium intybus TaxID=13427 RepID=A0ACB9BRF7_CICIN|nr:hypothetical protein L2E82_36416 [Cichorium intybus]